MCLTETLYGFTIEKNGLKNDQWAMFFDFSWGGKGLPHPDNIKN
jgi:hypothetical protein